MSDLLIPISAIIGCIFLPIIMVILIVWFKSKEKSKRYEVQAELYAKALEKGQPIPADWFVEPQKKRYALNTGIICIAVGISLFLFFLMVSAFAGQMDANAAGVFKAFTSVGIIPFLIGVAFLIIHFIEKKKSSNEAK